jgi:hypothetical protein
MVKEIGFHNTDKNFSCSQEGHMSKKWFLFIVLALSVVFITACEDVPGGSSTLTAIVYTGVSDAEIENGVTFNFLTGVKAMGNDGVDYTDKITITSTSSAVNVTTKALDTTAVGVHAVRYEVVVGEIVARQFRYITVKSPQVVAGEFLVNKDISQGALGWNDPSVVYVADGAAMTLTAENGELKAVVVAGSNSFTPRFGQMNIPFEQGKTYQVSFDARSSVAKEVSLQVGEVLAGPPYFTDFLPAAEPFVFRTITTTMQRYSYKFTMNLDNQKGGILFGLGTVKGQKVDATMYFDNFEIVESTPDADTTGPAISGTKDVSILVGGNFSPLVGVTALDVTDGDVTANITVVIKNSAGVVVSAVDTSEAGTYTVTYTVFDSLNNKTEITTTVTIQERSPLLFIDADQIIDGSFTTTPAVVPGETQNAAFQDITDAGFWYMYDGSWSGAAATYGVTEGKFEIDVTKVAGEVWHFMLKQKGITLLEGETYVLSFDAFASVNRPISVGFNPDIALEVVNLTTTSQTFEIEFTYEGATLETRIEFLFGGAVGKVTLDNVKLEIGVDEDALIDINTNEFVDGTFTTTPAVVPVETQNAAFQDITDAGFWYMYDGSWSGAAATYGVTDGKFEIDVTKVAGEVWHFMLKQKGIELVKNTLYTLSFTAFASVDRPISVGFNPDIALEVVNLTTIAKTYEISFFYTGDTLETRIEFLFGGAVGKVTLDDVILYESVYPALLTLTDSGEFVDGAFATTPAVVPGETQNAAFQDITDAGFWYIYDGSWSGAAATYGVTDGKFEIDVTKVAGEVWHFILKQKGIELVKNTLYTLSFTAFASVDRPISVGFNPDIALEVVNLTTTAKTYEISFYYTGDTLETRIEFLFGGAVGKVTLDDVVLLQVAAEEPAVDATAPVISGAKDSSILINSTFNPLTGVSALDNVDGDLTSAITVVIKDSLDAVVSSINTATAGVYKVTYTVIDTLQNTATITITVTVVAELAPPSNLVKNPDVSVDATNWNDASVIFAGDGSIEVTQEAGELKVVVVAGAESYMGRFGQMNIPFENGKTYEVSFDARSSVNKEIAIQVGELLSGPPWYTDFLPSTLAPADRFVFRTITTTMERYTFTFTMTQDNQKGGIIFGLGGVKGQRINATMFFDNFEVVEYVDTDGPEILGAKDVSINVGSTFNPLTGVTAVDVTDGAVTEDLSVVIKNSLDVVVTTLDTASEGVFTVTYSVTDSLGNSSNKTITVTVVTSVPVTQTQLKAFTDPDLAGEGGGMVNTHGGGFFRNIVWHGFVSGTTGAANQDGNANGVRITVFAEDGTTKLGEVLVTTSSTNFDIRTTNGFNNFLVAGNIIHIQAAPSTQGITNNYTFSEPLIYTLAS